MTLEENIREVNSAFVAIKEKIVECGVEVAEGTHTREYANKVKAVYETGSNQGKTDIYAEIEPINAELEQTLYGTDTGGKSFYDEFWDNYQENGNRTYYNYAFAGAGWNDENFKPKRNMVVTSAAYMFHACYIKNLKALMEELGITIDFSQCTAFTYTFGSSSITDIGVVDIRSLTSNLQYFLYNNASVVNFEKLIVSENNKFSSTAFQGASGLVEIRIEGVIGQNGFDVHWSTKLSNASLTSIIEHLSTTTSNLSVTLSEVAVNKAFETSEGTNDGKDSNEWQALIAKRDNWTINYQ